jgi:hypothetical protein
MMVRRRRAGLVLLGLALVGGLAFAFRAPLERAVLAFAIDVATGYRVAFDSLELGPSRVVILGLHVRRSGDPVLDADRVTLQYTLRDVFPGGKRRFGLRDLSLSGATFWLIRRRDGTFNVAGGVTPQAPATNPNAPASAAPPLQFTARIDDAHLNIIDPYRVYKSSRKITLEGLHGLAKVDSAGYTHYEARGQLVTLDTARAPVPVLLSGTVDQARGFGMHGLTVVGRLPLRDLVNYVLNSSTAHLFSGEASGLSLRAYALDLASPHPAGYHLAGSARIDGGVLYIPGLARPLRDLRGRMNVFDNGLAAPQMDGTLAGVPTRLAGTIFDWSAPSFELNAVARGPLSSARTLFNFSRNLPLGGGDLTARIGLEGPVVRPLVVVGIDAPRLTYGNIPFRNARGEVLFYDSAVTLAPLELDYGPLAVNVRGEVDIQESAKSQLIYDASAPPASLPYVAQSLPQVPLHVTGVVGGADILLATRGVFSGSGGGDRIAGFFNVDQHGDGMFGPLEVARADGTSLAGAFYQSRSTNESGFWLDAHNFLLKGNPRHPTLPGLTRYAPPEFDGVLDGALAGEGTPANFQVAGRVHAHNVIYGSLHIADVTGAIAGPPGDLRFGAVRATGPWGHFDGSGGYGDGRLALEGTYHGSFQLLEGFTGNLGASGAVDGPVALLIDSKRTLVQTTGASSPGARVYGVPVDALRGTLAIAGRRLDVYAATASVAGGEFTAKGALGDRRQLDVSLAGADARALRAAGSPLDRGDVTAIGRVVYDGAVPTFDGGVSVDGGSVQRLAVALNGDVRANASSVALNETSALVGPAYGVVGGTIENFGGGRPRYALSVAARDVPIAPIARLVVPRRHDIGGMLDTTLSIVGQGSAQPSVSGDVVVPEGTFNGLAFADARAHVGAGGSGFVAQNGSILVGTTRAQFGATLRGADASLDLSAPNAELSDFDNLFDTGDTLGGQGHVFGHFVKRGSEVVTNADVDIKRLRYRLFELGDATAHWVSVGRKVDAQVAFGGVSGRLAAGGTLTLPARAPVERLLQRSSFDGTAQVRGLDLGVWLPVLGYQVPVTGRIDADATLRGPLQDPTVHTDVTLIGGNFGKFPVSRALLSLDSSATQATIRHAELDLPSVLLTASGTFGFGSDAPLQLALHANSPDVGALAQKLFGEQLPLSGTAEADIHVDGRRAKPHVYGGFDIEKGSIRGVGVPRALGEVELQGRDLVLSDAEVVFVKGTLYLAGSVPLQLAPFGLGPPQAPLALEIAAKGIDLSDFQPLLGKNSTLNGLLDGRVSLGGTAGNPQLVGDLALSGGTVESQYETVPLTNLAARLSFTSKTVTLESFHAEGGGGTLDLSGNAQFPDLVHPGADATYAFKGNAKSLRLNLPAYGQGQIDGTFSLAHQPEQLALISGSLTAQNAVIPFSALLFAGGIGASGPVIQTAGAPAPQPRANNVAFNLNLIAGNNVRVRSGNVDIGARGQLQVGGTLAAPQLSGGFDSTGGTLSYFNTVFRVQSGSVTFSLDRGVIPSLDAVATTHVINPDPNAFRNPTGTADITLDLTGPVTSLSLQLSSDPSYDRQTILGLLLNAPAIGATNLFASSVPGQAAVPPGVLVQQRSTGELSVGQEAFGILNAQFTRNLLSPIETQVGGALGLSSLAFNVDYTGGLGLSARKVLGKQTNLIYAQSFTYPYRQTLGFAIKPNATTAAQFTVFQTFGSQGVGYFTPANNINPTQPTNLRALVAQPSSGGAGFSFSLQKLF